MAEVGRVTDDHGHVLIVGTDQATVTFRTLGPAAVALDAHQAGELGRLLGFACWEAGRQQGPVAAA